MGQMDGAIFIIYFVLFVIISASLLNLLPFCMKCQKMTIKYESNYHHHNWFQQDATVYIVFRRKKKGDLIINSHRLSFSNGKQQKIADELYIYEMEMEMEMIA
jgi:predicted transcriptional regulator of viral defense system